MFSRHRGFGGCLRGNASAPTWERLQDKWEAVGWECSCPSWRPRAPGLFPKPGWFPGFYETWAYWIVFLCVWTFPKINPVVFWKIIKRCFFCGLNSGLCHLGRSKNLGPRNWRFSSTIHVFTLPTKKRREDLLFWLVFYHLSYGLHDVFFLLSRYIPVLKTWDRNNKKTKIWPPCLASPPPGGTREQPRPSY